jgi:hypothetical protein
MNVEIRGLPAVSGASRAPSAPRWDNGTNPEVPSQTQAEAPRSEVPGTVAALPVAEAALRQVLAAQGSARAPQDAASMALDLLRNVEALLRASAPAGVSAEDLGAAAAQLVARQGLVARLVEAPSAVAGPWTDEARPEDAGPTSVDTRL